jgi:hypothetical protein
MVTSSGAQLLQVPARQNIIAINWPIAFPRCDHGAPFHLFPG